MNIKMNKSTRTIAFIFVLCLLSSCSTNKNSIIQKNKYIYKEENTLPIIKSFSMDGLVFKSPLVKNRFVVTGDVFRLSVNSSGNVSSVRLSEKAGRTGTLHIYESSSHKVVYLPASTKFVEIFSSASKSWVFNSTLEQEFDCFIGIVERSKPDNNGSDFQYLACGQNFDFSYID